MIKVYYDKSHIRIEGHSYTDVCAAVSSITYMGINSLLGYHPNSIIASDDNQRILIVFCSNDKFINIIKKVMIDMYNDIQEQSPTGSISVEEVKNWRETFKDEIEYCDPEL